MGDRPVTSAFNKQDARSSAPGVVTERRELSVYHPESRLGRQLSGAGDSRSPVAVNWRGSPIFAVSRKSNDHAELAMTFTFQCPQGHDLRAEPADEGRTCLCPQCGARMVVPAAPIDAAPAIRIEGQKDQVRDIRWNDGTETLVENPFPTDSSPTQFHIPCPNGHLLEATIEMLGKAAMCPKCQAKFSLDRERSVEFQAAAVAKEARRESRLERRWLHWAIVALVLAIIFVSLLFALATAT